MGFLTQYINMGVFFIAKIINIDLKKYIDLVAKFGKNYKYGPKNHPFRIIKMGHVSEASAARPYQNIKEVSPPPPPPPAPPTRGANANATPFPLTFRYDKRPPFKFILQLFWFVLLMARARRMG